MTNPFDGEVKINIGGRERCLRFSLGALASLQDDLGLDNVNELNKLDITKVPYLQKFLLWGLKDDDPELTENAVKSWVVPIADAVVKVSIAFNLAIWGTPQPPEEEKATSKKKKRKDLSNGNPHSEQRMES